MLSLASIVASLSLSLVAPLAVDASPSNGLFAPSDPAPISVLPETEAERAERMRWWNESRFGMFIHWGLYSVAAGEWNGKNVPGAGEWILNGGQIKPEDYEVLLKQFNPVKFDAKQWVEIAKNAGMRYIVITSKHHEGFGLWDSALTDWDIGGTPFKRDVLKELADASQAAGIRLCFYHSIMDWHHPDYLPRRAWDTRPTDSADFNRYRDFLKGQLKELLSGRYGDVGILWFDGEWESTWTHEFGKDLDDWVRSLQKNIIVNNRVDVGRDGMVGFSKAPEFRGDYGTPEQTIPATGVPGAAWETCMTMNDTWGFHKNDHNWKPAATLIRMLIDIASKGGNFLLNVGPTALGEIPPESVERLAAMGTWMKTNGESIWGTVASPFSSLPWGRCTMKSEGGGTRLYLHVFDWPTDGTLVVPGLLNSVKSAKLLGGGSLATSGSGGNIMVTVPSTAPDPVATVIALDLDGPVRIIKPVELKPSRAEFVDAVQVSAGPMPEGIVVRYTKDGSAPTKESPELKAIALRATTTITAQAFLDDQPVGSAAARRYEAQRIWPTWNRNRNDEDAVLRWKMVDGTFNNVQELRAALPEIETWDIGAPQGFGIPPRAREQYGVAYRALIKVPYDGMWTFRLGSDDGSMLLIDERIVVNNDGKHSYKEVEAAVPLSHGLHLMDLYYFQADGQQDLKLMWDGPSIPWKPITQRDLLLRR